ncbi:PAS domain S-box protein [[Clostridium] fimetarium]|uniref:Stage 0 sporulation protein A homolog n=1 Tax=[Clostridium] fimetarium TaxID=99656 RepID=A0A1I0PJI8_9FIRM|nr:PAS domain S-box protein [[Clostridium] fimetarium]SEW13958.1 PAS domain S-box-containing protein [[Clostridium] fimetarium]
MIPILFLIFFTLFLVYLIFGFYVFLKNWKSLKNRILFSLCMNLSIWALGYAFMTISPNQETANFWRLVAASGWCIVYSTWLDFAILVKEESKKWMSDLRRLLIYLPPLFFFIMNVIYEPIVVKERLVYIWNDTYVINLVEVLFTLYYVIFIISGILIIYKWGKNSKLNIEKKQATIIVITSLISFVLTILNKVISAFYGINIFPLGVAMFSIALLGIYYAITKYKMMSISSLTANEYILKTITDPVILIGNDLFVISVNSAALDLTGFLEKEIKGISINRLIANIELNREAFQILMNTGAVKNIEVDLMTKNGISMPCLFSGSLINNDLEDTLGIACIFHDISDRKIAENILLKAHKDLEKKVYERTEKLEEINTQLEDEILIRIKAQKGLISSEEKFRALMKQSIDGIVVFDQDTRKVVEINDAAYNLLGITEAEQEAELIWKQLVPNYDKIRLVINNLIKKSTVSSNASIKYTLRNGICRDFKLYITYVGYSNKQFIMVTIRDITDELIMEERKQQISKMDSLGNLAGGIAHDFNNILAGIMGYTQLTLDEFEEGTSTSENLSEVIKLGERAKKLISQILIYSKKTLVAPINVDIRIIIEDILKMLKATLPININIDYRLEGDSFYVYADQGELHQLVMNLCVNAKLAMSKNGGTLKVILSKITVEEKMQIEYQVINAGKYIKLEVIDGGCGIEETVIKRIFEPFFTTRGSQGGTGLGLSVVQGIISRLDGVIMVDSVPNRGSTFTVLLPTANNDIIQEPILDKKTLNGAARILFIDDEESIVNSVQKLLHRLGYIVTGVFDPREALSIFKKDKDLYDIVLTDQIMPDMTGDVLVRELRIIRPDIPVVVCSGYIHEINHEDDNKTAYLLKPVSINEYVIVIEKLLKDNENILK